MARITDMEEPRRNPSDLSPYACIEVQSLPAGATCEELYDLFSKYGDVADIAIYSQDESQAQVQFKHSESVRNVLRQHPKSMPFLSCQLEVRAAPGNRTLHFSGVASELTQEELLAEVRKHGEPLDCRKALKEGKKSCVIKFANRIHATVVKKMLSTEQPEWIVNWAGLSTDHPPPGTDLRTVFIGGLDPHTVSKEALTSKFCTYGKITFVDLLRSSHSKSACGFVRFEDELSALEAIEAEHGTVWMSRRLRVLFSDTPEMKMQKRGSPPPSALGPVPPSPFEPPSRPASPYFFVQPQMNVGFIHDPYYGVQVLFTPMTFGHFPYYSPLHHP